jgi:hypothetical protein
MQQIKELSPDHSATILDIINDAANAYKGAIPDDRRKEPYMSTEELADEIRAGPIHRYYHSMVFIITPLAVSPNAVEHRLEKRGPILIRCPI